jgi:hypothetical protein
LEDCSIGSVFGALPVALAPGLNARLHTTHFVAVLD